MTRTSPSWRVLLFGTVLCGGAFSGHAPLGPLLPSAIAGEPARLRWAGENWRVETEVSPLAASTQQEADGSLYLQAPKGMTIWLLRPLSGAYTLSFDRRILTATPACRLSDMNFFWAAHERNGALPAPRDGVLDSYNSLVMFYAGIGGNTNTTTRFRRYDGSGARLLVQESLQKKDLLQAGHTYRITLTVDNKATIFFLDGKKIFSQRIVSGPAGYFGIRTVGSCQKLSRFMVRQD